MLARFRDRAARVKDRGMPPVAGPEARAVPGAGGAGLPGLRDRRRRDLDVRGRRPHAASRLSASVDGLPDSCGPHRPDPRSRDHARRQDQRSSSRDAPTSSWTETSSLQRSKRSPASSPKAATAPRRRSPRRLRPPLGARSATTTAVMELACPLPGRGVVGPIELRQSTRSFGSSRWRNARSTATQSVFENG